ncbi:sulfotransferase 2A1-like [Glandiceps talaboti]
MEKAQNNDGLPTLSPYNEDYGCNVFLDNGFPLPPGMTEKRVKELQDFQVHDDDVFVVGYPKSGTNWLQIAVSKMGSDWGTCKITEKGRVPVLELPGQPALEGYEKCLEASSPRLIKSHLPLQYFPAQRAEKKCKVVYIARNPKDACVSWYNMNKSFAPINFSLTFEQYVIKFAEGKVFYGNYANHIIDWRKLDINDNVLHVSFEEMKRDTNSVLKKVSTFIGRPMSDDEIQSLADSISFDNMKKNDREKYNVSTVDDKVSPFIRKGAIGDWKTHFTVAQSELFDDEIVKKLKENGIQMMYK